MPKLFVVTNQKPSGHRPRRCSPAAPARAARDKAIAAIRAANPNLDLDRLSPGDVVVIPAVTGLRRAAEDPVGEVGKPLAERVRDGLASLSSTASRARSRGSRQEGGAGALPERGAEAALAVEPLIAEYVEINRAQFRQDDAEAKRQLGELRSAAAGWSEDLDALRDLH